MKNVLLVLLLVAGSASATPGRLDANGCHTSAKVGYHCHAGRAAVSGGLPGGESQTQRDRRLARECKGRPNAGACLGFAR